MTALNDARQRRASQTRIPTPPTNGVHPAPAKPPVRVAPTIPQYQPFPVEHLPKVLRDMVESVAAAVNCDPAFAALPGLVVSAAATGAAVSLSPKRGWSEPSSLYGCVVADSGSAKSPAADPFLRAAALVEDDLEEEYTAAVQSYDASVAAHNEDPTHHPKPPTPKREYFGVSDVTVERLIENLSTSSRGLLIDRDELTGWFGDLTRYRSSGSNLPMYLTLFDGGAVSYQRRTGNPRDVRVKRGVVSLYGGTQPEVFRSVLADPNFVHSGLLSRFLIAMPPGGAVRWSDAEIDPEATAAFTAAVRFLRAVPFDPRREARIGMTPEAKARFVKFTNRMADKADDQDGGPMKATASKLKKIALRLALVHHCLLTAAAEVDCGTQTLAEPSMAAGVGLAEWFYGEAERVFAMLSERPEDTSARKLAELVKRKGGRMTPRDLMRSNERRYPTTQAAELALDGLASAGLGEWSEATAANNKVIRTLTLLPDARRCPTLTDPDGDTPPDGVPDAAAETPQNQGEITAASGTVGRRADTPTPPPPEPAPNPASGATSGRVWADPEAWAAALTGYGTDLPTVIAWLNAHVTPADPYPDDAAPEDILLDHRRRVIEALSRPAEPDPEAAR